ncbi:Crp/Fnr family transcriptional regulator [Tenacibaculum amylolyticum]|uniref:Crp/Fnr family transcriptional regulator n=1 Tax=Tenacibaculum amylolyticum TaxID=104269 RepID=UPI00389582CD
MLDSIQNLKQNLSKAAIWDKELQLHRWDEIKRANTIDTNLYFIEEGCVRVYFTENTYEHSLYFGYEGSLISALDSFFSEKPSSLIIQCLQKTRVKVISKTTFYEYIKNYEIAETLWQKALGDLSVWHLEREKDLLIKSPKLRYQRVLERQPLLLQNVPHKYIASYLNISPETFSRIQNS